MPASPPEQEAHGITLSKASLTGLAKTDAMPPALRACVHEFGFAIVDAFVSIGITESRHIRHLVTVCWDGARSPADCNFKTKSPLLNKLDCLLIGAGCPISAAMLLRVLFQSGFVILNIYPNEAMVDASIEETGKMGLVSKREKHRGRLAAALRAGAVRLWPHLFVELRR